MTQAKPSPDSVAAGPVIYSGTGRFLTEDELELWTSFLDAGRIIDSVLEHDLISHHEMTHREYEILVRLDGAGGVLRMSELARRIEASAPLITQTVERLQRRGWVTREAVDGDGRGVQARLLDAGRTALLHAARPHAALIRDLLVQRIPSEQRDAVRMAMRDVADHLRRHRSGLACDDPACPLQPGTALQ